MSKDVQTVSDVHFPRQQQSSRMTSQQLARINSGAPPIFHETYSLAGQMYKIAQCRTCPKTAGLHVGKNDKNASGPKSKMLRFALNFLS